jgi:hypothetical protein
MQQVADWLEKLGLGQYAQRFAENDIDASVLPHLTDQSLNELGVSLGHRLKILAAIKELGGLTSAPPQHAASSETKPQDAAERAGQRHWRAGRGVAREVAPPTAFANCQVLFSMRADEARQSGAPASMQQMLIGWRSSVSKSIAPGASSILSPS